MAGLFLLLFFPFLSSHSLLYFPFPESLSLQWTTPDKIAPSSSALSFSWAIFHSYQSCIPLNFPIIFQLSHDMENIFGTSTYFVYFFVSFASHINFPSKWKRSDLAFTTSPWMFGKLCFTYFIYSSIYQSEGWLSPDVIWGAGYSTER